VRTSRTIEIVDPSGIIKHVKLSRYNSGWPIEYDSEHSILKEILGDLASRIDHVGSTSVPGLQAKAVIDIQISVPELAIEVYKEKLTQVGYKYLRTDPPLGDAYPFFHKPARWPTTHHVHLCLLGSDEERKHLAFRDWLRMYPRDRDHYGALKDDLARDVDEKDLSTLFDYTEKKSAWIQEITQKAITAGLGK